MRAFNVTLVKNPRYANAEKSAIDCICTFSHIDGEHPFTARADDPEWHGQKIWLALIEGVYGPIAAYIEGT